MSSGTIQIPVLFDMSGDTIVFGEDTDGDFVSSHLDFVLDMTTEVNDISLNASDISAAIVIGDQDTGDNIFYAGGSSGNVAVDELCNRIAKAITRGKLVHLPKSGNHSNSGIPMGGRADLVDTNGINQGNNGFDKYAIKYQTSIAPIGDEQMLGEAMARVASIHLVGSPLSAGIFQSATSVQTDLETASSQTFGSTAFYNALAVQLSKVLGGSKSSSPMYNAFSTTDEVVMGSPPSHGIYVDFETAGVGTGNGTRSTDYAQSGSYSLTTASTRPYYHIHSTTTPAWGSWPTNNSRGISCSIRGKDGATGFGNGSTDTVIWSATSGGGGFAMSDHYDINFVEDFETVYTGTDFADFAITTTPSRYNSHSAHRAGNVLAGSWATATSVNKNWKDIAVSSDYSKMYAVASGDHIYSSTDSGSTWTQVGTTGPAKTWVGVATSSDGSTIAALEQNGKVWVSNTSGSGWTQNYTNKKWYKITMSGDGTKIVAITNPDTEQSIYYSGDSGQNWAQSTIAGGSNKPWSSIQMSTDGTVVYAGAESIWKSTNGGANFSDLSVPRYEGGWFTGIHISSDKTKIIGVAGGNQNAQLGAIYYSTDTGSTWTRIATMGTKRWLDVTGSTDSTTLWATAGLQDYTSDREIWKSADGGSTWTQTATGVSKGATNWKIAAADSTASTVIAVPESQIIHKFSSPPLHFYHATTSTTPALTSGLNTIMGVTFHLHTTDNHGTDDKVLFHAFKNRGAANEWEYKFYIRGDATESNRKLTFYRKYAGSLSNAPNTIWIGNTEYSKDTTLTAGNIAVYDAGPSVFALNNWAGIFLPFNGAGWDEIYLLGDKDDTPSARSTATTYIDILRIMHSSNGTTIPDGSISGSGGNALTSAGNGNQAGYTTAAFFKAGASTDRRLSVSITYIGTDGVTSTFPNSIRKVFWDGVEKTPVNDTNSQNTTGRKEFDILASVLEDGQWHNLTIGLGGVNVTDIYLLCNHRNEQWSSMYFTFMDDFRCFHNNYVDLTDAQLLSLATGGEGTGLESTGNFLHAFDASGVAVPALKSIYEQLMNIPGRSQIMESRDISGVRDNSNITLAGGFPFISGDKLVMYLRPKIVFAAQTFAEQHTTLLGFPNQTSPNVPVYNISNDGNGGTASVITGQSYSQSSSQNNDYVFENACHELQNPKTSSNLYWICAGGTYNAYNAANPGEHSGAGMTSWVAPGHTVPAGILATQVFHEGFEGATYPNTDIPAAPNQRQGVNNLIGPAGSGYDGVGKAFYSFNRAAVGLTGGVTTTGANRHESRLSFDFGGNTRTLSFWFYQTFENQDATRYDSKYGVLAWLGATLLKEMKGNATQGRIVFSRQGGGYATAFYLDGVLASNGSNAETYYDYGVWHHVALVHNFDITSVIMNHNSASGNEDLYTYHGHYDDIRAFSGELTQAEVLQVAGLNQLAGEWGQVDVGESTFATKLELWGTNNVSQPPREFKLLGSTTGGSWDELLHVTDAGPWQQFTNSHSWDLPNPGSYQYYRIVIIKLASSVTGGTASERGGIGKFILKGVKSPSEVAVGSGAGDPATQPAAAGVDISGLITNFTSTAVNISDAFPGNTVIGREAEINKWGWMGSANSDSLTLETTDIQDVNTIDLHIWKITITL